MPIAVANRSHTRPIVDVDAAIQELTRVDGVGIKTAAITLMFGCGADLCAVDTHLVRILRRLRVVPEKAAPDRAFRILRPLVPPGRGIELHLQLIRHGRETCKALRPRCGACPVRSLCPHRIVSGTPPDQPAVQSTESRRSRRNLNNTHKTPRLRG